jgi:hypothetical protein
MMSTDTIAYIAGLFDGEGCVTCKKVKTKRKDRPKEFYNQWYIRCEIAMTDKHIIQWLHETLGFGWSKEKKYHNRPTHHKRQWRWSCGYRDALLFAKIIWPYVQVKIHDIEKIIDHYDDVKPDRKNVIDLNLYKKTKYEGCPHN